ncbi:MAG: hemin uptake protein HemP [Candidatus Binatia bacterium]
MGKEILPNREGLGLPVPRSQRRWIHTADLMQGAQKIVLLHRGEEYVLRITKAGKLILTK